MCDLENNIPTVRKRKQVDEIEPSNSRRLASTTAKVPRLSQSALEKKCEELEAQVKKMKDEWMRQ